MIKGFTAFCFLLFLFSSLLLWFSFENYDSSMGGVFVRKGVKKHSVQCYTCLPDIEALLLPTSSLTTLSSWSEMHVCGSEACLFLIFCFFGILVNYHLCLLFL